MQGTKKTPEFIDLEIDRIVEMLKEKVKNLKGSTLRGYILSIRNQIVKDDENLGERFGKIWGEIVENTLEFDRKSKLLEELEKIKIGDLREVFENIFYSNPRKLSLQMYSGNYSIPLNFYNDQTYFLNKKIKSKVLKSINAFDKFKLISSKQSLNMTQIYRKLK